MNFGTKEEIISLFRTSNNSRPILLLGAGASFHTGIPLAKDAVIRITKAAYAKTRLGIDWRKYDQVTTSDWKPFLEGMNWYKPFSHNIAEAFPLAVKNLLMPDEFRKEFLLEMIRPQNTNTLGYTALAEIMSRHLCWTVLTTNFDTALKDKLENRTPVLKKVLEINKTSDSISAFQLYGKFQIVYLHGAVEYYTDKISDEETHNLDSKLVNSIRPCLSDSPLIVIGYRGAEKSIMEHLLRGGIDSSNKYRKGIYWCVIDENDIHCYVKTLAKEVKENFKFVKIEGFDELMSDINSQLKNENLSLQNITNGQGEYRSDSFDDRVLEDKSYDDIDDDLVKVILTEYFKRLDIDSETQQFKQWLINNSFLIRIGSTIRPTFACYLLFGKNVQKEFKFAKIVLEINNKSRQVFDGNLIQLYKNLLDHLNSEQMNPTLRIKKTKDSEDTTAYHPRAISELLVNMIVHKDYSIEEYSKIQCVSGESITFITPGSFPKKIIDKVKVNDDGEFEPVRGLSEIRNRLLADIFYGIGPMDKAGSGMSDVKDYMIEHNGKAKYTVLKDDSGISCSLLQAIQKSPKINNIAQSIVKTEIYITNLIPFKVIPSGIYLFPTKDMSYQTIIQNLPQDDFLPIYTTDIHHDVSLKKLICFADLSKYKLKFETIVDFSKVEFIDTMEFLKDTDRRKRFVWLVMKHWERYLFSKYNSGLKVIYNKKRAFFELLSGHENKITYVSRLNRKTSRAVVKKRETKRRIFHENEGISYSIENFGNSWFMCVKPIYVFTQKDGKTPVANFLRSRYTTSRMKFDRNKNVEDDLHFWLKFLSSSEGTINIGGNDVYDLILESNYVENEIPIR